MDTAKNPMLEWGRSSIRQELLFRIEEMAALDAAACRDREIERWNIQQLATNVKTDSNSRGHADYFHESGSAFRTSEVLERIRGGETIPCSTASLLSLHGLIFSPREGAGMLSARDNGLKVRDEDGNWQRVYHATPAQEKSDELDWAFAMYNQAKVADFDLAPAYAICLSEYLMKIHPFGDGNGRVSRLMLISELRAAGMEHAADIPFERCYAKYRKLVCCMLGKADGGSYSRSIYLWPYVRLTFDLIKLSYRKLPKSQKISQEKQ